MTIKVKLRGDKATVRFSNQMEAHFFATSMVSVRDSLTPHPKISVKNREGELPSLPKPKHMEKPIVVKPKPIKTKVVNPSGEIIHSGL